MRFRDTGTRLRGVTVPGEYNNPSSIDWTEATLGKLDLPCEFQPESVTEDVVQQQRVVVQPEGWFYPTADIKAADRFRYRGDDYEVDGTPKLWSPHGRDHHLHVKFLRVTGG